MPSFDARTVVLVAFLTNSLFCLVLFALNRSIGRRLPGLRHGAWAALMWSIGSALITGRGALSDLVSILWGNMAISGGILLMHAAIHLSNKDSLSRPTWPVIAAIAGAIAMTLMFLLGGYSGFLMLATGYNAALFLACLAATWRARPSGFGSACMALSLCLAIFASTTRFLVHAITNDTVLQAFEPSTFQRAYFALMAFCLLSISLGFTMITYERLNKILSAANAALETEVAARTADLRMEIERKRALERLVASTAEEERRRIGHELHDDLGQRLTGISLVAEALTRELGKAGQSLASHADAIQRAASGAIAQVRALAHGLIPVAPEPEGVGEALAALANASTVRGLACAFEYDEPVDIKNQDVATNLYRIAQEAMANATRHAQAQRVAMRLDVVDGKVELSIADDGRGFEWPRAARGIATGRGMGIMEYRASLIGYRLDIASTPGQGSIVKVIEC